jgi:phosphoenolpyruvate carboxylase
VGLARALSITERALPVPPSFRAELERALQGGGEAEAIRTRNPAGV